MSTDEDQHVRELRRRMRSLSPASEEYAEILSELRGARRAPDGATADRGPQGERGRAADHTLTGYRHPRTSR
jgi:hypothetical protein